MFGDRNMSQKDGAGAVRQYKLHAQLADDMQRLLDSGEGKDIVFVVNSMHPGFEAHSSIVAVRCSALKSRIIKFRTEKKDANCRSDEKLYIPIDGVSELAFRKVLKFIYTGRIALVPDDIFDVCALSGNLCVRSLQDILLVYIYGEEHADQVILVLDRALRDSLQNHMLIAKLTIYIAENCQAVLEKTAVELVSAEVLTHIIKQENLAASEVDLWDVLVEWSCHQCGLAPQKKVSQMTAHDQSKVAGAIKMFCRPGLLRILNFDASTFFSEVEPLSVFPPSETLLKYRFDAAVGEAAFDDLFPLDRYNFLLRVRQRTVCYESDGHPHPRGVRRVYKVELPQWVSEVKIAFDPRTALGRYADLEFFEDVERTSRLFSVSASRQHGLLNSANITAGAISRTRAKPLEPIYICRNTFWFSFYAPQNVGDLAWGYKFTVSVVR